MSKNRPVKTIVGSFRVFATTFFMLVLLFVSISTATLAWFSANSRVSTGSITFQAQSDNAVNIRLGWDKTAGLDTISFLNPASGIGPMVPSVNPVVGTTTSAQFLASFTTATVDPEDGLFNSAGVFARPYICYGNPNPADLSVEQQYFYVINGSDTNAVTVSITIVVTGDNLIREMLRVSVFATRSDTIFQDLDTATMYYLGTICPIVATADYDNTHYGTIAEGTHGTTSFAEQTVDTDPSLTFTVGGANAVKLAVICWYDGVYLNEGVFDNQNDLNFDNIISSQMVLNFSGS